MEEIDQNEQSTSEVITVDGNAFVKNNDGSLIDEEFEDDSNLIYR